MSPRTRLARSLREVGRGGFTYWNATSSGAVAAIASAAAVVLAPLDAAGRSEVDAAPLVSTAIRASPLFAQRDRRPRGLAQLTLLANGAPRRFQHFEKP